MSDTSERNWHFMTTVVCNQFMTYHISSKHRATPLQSQSMLNNIFSARIPVARVRSSCTAGRLNIRRPSRCLYSHARTCSCCNCRFAVGSVHNHIVLLILCFLILACARMMLDVRAVILSSALHRPQRARAWSALV